MAQESISEREESHDVDRGRLTSHASAISIGSSVGFWKRPHDEIFDQPKAQNRCRNASSARHRLKSGYVDRNVVLYESDGNVRVKRIRHL
jgi:hypothetical protein